MIIPIKEEQLCLLDLVNMEFVNKDKSFIGDDGVVYFNIDQEKFPIPVIHETDKLNIKRVYYSTADFLERTLFESIFENMDAVPNESDEYYIKFHTLTTIHENHYSTSNKETVQGFVEEFAIKHDGKIYSSGSECDVLFYLKHNKSLAFQTYMNKFINFTTEANEWVREKIRTVLFDYTKVIGNFSKDMLKSDTYFQETDKHVFYIIHKWWEEYNKKQIEWQDITNGDKLTFVAQKE